MALKEQVIKDRSFYNIDRMKNRPGICEARFAWIRRQICILRKENVNLQPNSHKPGFTNPIPDDEYRRKMGSIWMCLQKVEDFSNSLLSETLSRGNSTLNSSTMSPGYGKTGRMAGKGQGGHFSLSGRYSGAVQSRLRNGERIQLHHFFGMKSWMAQFSVATQCLEALYFENNEHL